MNADHVWTNAYGDDWTAEAPSDLCFRCGRTPDVHPTRCNWPLGPRLKLRDGKWVTIEDTCVRRSSNVDSEGKVRCIQHVRMSYGLSGKWAKAEVIRMTVVDRAFEIAAATFPRAPRDRLAHPFGFDEHESHQWRVSRDVWDALCDYAGLNEPDPSPESRLLGEYIRIDEGLPPNSMLLEPIAVRAS